MGSAAFGRLRKSRNVSLQGIGIEWAICRKIYPIGSAGHMICKLLDELGLSLKPNASEEEAAEEGLRDGSSGAEEGDRSAQALTRFFCELIRRGREENAGAERNGRREARAGLENSCGVETQNRR